MEESFIWKLLWFVGEFPLSVCFPLEPGGAAGLRSCPEEGWDIAFTQKIHKSEALGAFTMSGLSLGNSRGRRKDRRTKG